MNKTKTFKVLNNCLCQHYLHEVSSHWRPGLVRKELFRGDVVTKIGETNNLIGNYIRVTDSKGNHYEIEPKDLVEID